VSIRGLANRTSLVYAIDRWYLPMYNGMMSSKISIDKAGRVVLPKPLRDKLSLHPGDHLAIETNDQVITLRPIRPQPSIRKKRGIWVYHGEPSHDDIVDFIASEREARIRELAD